MVYFNNKYEMTKASEEEIQEFFADTIFEGIYSKKIKSIHTEYYKGHIHSIKINGISNNVLGTYINVPISANDIPEGECTFKCRIKENGFRISPKTLRSSNKYKIEESFINRLQKQRSAYNYASQVRTQAESLKQLSAGIYTEEERFVYELLQNAVDAYIDTNYHLLDIRIEIKDDMLCFMHNGAPFSERDIEGLCDVGKSNKASGNNILNKKKIGYKGIGFKSVFMQSVDYVCVKSGEYCFKFDKKACTKIMPSFPEDPLVPDDIPWQIVPIECDCPTNFETKGFNVATYIHNSNNAVLVEKITALLQSPQFLLFLNAENIRISLIHNGNHIITAAKKSLDGKVYLLCDDNIVSRWLVHTSNPVPVNTSVRESIVHDFNTPQKLKEATDFVLSFAISINSDDEIEPIKDSVVYTFLPTSYKNLGTPFLVNANFITDAGRQQLHKTSQWNQIIFDSIPDQYLRWIATLSSKYKDYYKVLPNKYPKSQDELTNVFSKSLLKAIEEIPFIPRLADGKKLKVSEAVIDKIKFADAIGKTKFIEYVNESCNKTYTCDALVPNEAISLMKSYGVYVFDKDALLHFVSNVKALQNISTINENKQLIEFLYDYCHNKENDSSDLEQLLPVAEIIFDDNGKLNKAINLFFPTIENEIDDTNQNLSFINKDLYDCLSNDIITWLGKEGLGIKELNQSSIIEHILSHPENINTDNALNIGRFLFSSWQKENFLDASNNFNYVNMLPFLSKSGNMIPISNLYLSNEYNPEDNLESVFNDFEYISSEYVMDSEWEDWAFFLKKCGIRYKIDIMPTILEATSTEGRKYTEKYYFLDSAVSSFRNKKHYRSGYCGYLNPIININLSLYYFPYINPNTHNYELYKFVFSKILSLPMNEDDYEDRIFGEINYWKIRVNDTLIEHTPNLFSIKYNSFMEYVLSNEQMFPIGNGNFEMAKNTFLNNATICEYGEGYLPIIDINTSIDDSWLKILPFKKELVLDDYLTILDAISKDSSMVNKKRVSLIYQKLVELGYQKSERIKEWGIHHTLLSALGDMFLPPSQLSYITIDGFKNESQVFVGKIEHSLLKGVVELLETFGVKVITNDKIHPKFEENIASNQLGKLLIDKLDYVTLLKGAIKDRESYRLEKDIIKNKIMDSEFYHCKNIQLSYGNDNDVILKSTYALDNKFYYVGSLKPTRIEPLIPPLCKHLDLKNVSEEMLIVLITDNRDDILDYLEDKGYPIEFVENIVSQAPSSDKSLDIGNIEYQTVPSEGKGYEDSKQEDIRDEGTVVHNEDTYEKNFEKYSEEVKQFMGNSFSMPTDKKNAQHIIARYRILMYLKGLGDEYTFKDNFNEQEYIRTSGYASIPLATGRTVNPQGAEFGIWHLSPNVWKDILEQGNYACLCTGHGEQDFKLIKNENDIKAIAESTKNVFMRLSPTENMNIMDTIKSVFDAKKIILDNNFVFEKIYSNRDVHLMLMVHETKDLILNSMFDSVFKTEGDGEFNLSDY